MTDEVPTLRQVVKDRVVPALVLAYGLIEATDYDSASFEDRMVNPAHAAIDGLLHGDTALEWVLEDPAAAIDSEKLADAVHRTLCGAFTSMDPQQCVYGRERDLRVAEALAKTSPEWLR